MTISSFVPDGHRWCHRTELSWPVLAELSGSPRFLCRNRQHWENHERRLRFTMTDRIIGDFDIRSGVVCHNRVAAVGIADTARKVAARYVHLQTTPGGEGVMDGAETKRYLRNMVWL